MNEYEAKWHPVIKDEDNEILKSEYRIAKYLRKVLHLDNQPERSKREDDHGKFRKISDEEWDVTTKLLFHD